MTESIIGPNSKTLLRGRAGRGSGPALRRRPGKYIGPPHLHANFGYALTCHKSQGSEWNQVLVLIENEHPLYQL
jgi:hypothetical protein